MGAALGPAALAMQVIGGVVQGVGEKQKANAQAAVDDQNSLLVQQSGEQDAYNLRRQARQQDGAALAALGGSGAAIGTGSAADILTDAALQRERDVSAIRDKAASQSANYQQAASDERKAGRNALITSVFGGAANALSSASSLRNQRLVSAQRASGRATTINTYGPSYGTGR